MSTAAPFPPRSDPVRPATLDLMVEFSRQMVGVAYRSLEGLDPRLDLPSFRALAFIEHHPGTTMGVLAANVDLPASSATRLCDRLAAAGWLTRQHNPTNRRQVEVTLTEEGRQLVAVALLARARELEAMMDRLPPGLKAVLQGLLPDLVAAAAHPAADTTNIWWV